MQTFTAGDVSGHFVVAGPQVNTIDPPEGTIVQLYDTQYRPWAFGVSAFDQVTGDMYPQEPNLFCGMNDSGIAVWSSMDGSTLCPKETATSIAELSHALMQKHNIDPFNVGIAYTDTKVAFGLPTEQSVLNINKESIVQTYPGMGLFYVTKQEREDAKITDAQKQIFLTDKTEIARFYQDLKDAGYKMTPASQAAHESAAKAPILSQDQINKNALKAFRMAVSANLGRDKQLLGETEITQYDFEVAKLLAAKKVSENLETDLRTGQ